MPHRGKPRTYAEPLQERLRRRSRLNPENGCIEWTGSVRRGYGQLTIGSRVDGGKRSIGAHQLAALIAYGPAPDGQEVRHLCHNRLCVNHEHLAYGTRQDNVDDRERAGRNNPPRGEAASHAKLTDDDVRALRRLHALGLSIRGCARRYGVNKTTAAKAIRGLSWAHVPAELPEALT